MDSFKMIKIEYILKNINSLDYKKADLVIVTY